MIGKDDVKKLAELSRMELTPEEISKLSKDIESILAYVNELTEIATKESVNEAGTLRNVMRKDEKPHKSGMFTDVLLKAAPEREKNYFKVKKILK